MFFFSIKNRIKKWHYYDRLQEENKKWLSATNLIHIFLMNKLELKLRRKEKQTNELSTGLILRELRALSRSAILKSAWTSMMRTSADCSDLFESPSHSKPESVKRALQHALYSNYELNRHHFKNNIKNQLVREKPYHKEVIQYSLN